MKFNTMDSTTLIKEIENYWDRRPCNIRHSSYTLGTKEYFDEVEKRKYFVEPHIPEFASFKNWAGKKVLEIGCGIGTDAVNFARVGAIYTGLELSMKSLEITKKRFEVFNLTGRLIHGDAENMSHLFEPGEFDLIYAFGVLHHTPTPSQVIKEIRKIIQPRGQLRICLYAKNSWKGIMIDAGLDQPEAQDDCPLATFYTPKDVHDLLKGFNINSLSQDHIFPYIVSKYKNYEYELQPWFKAMPPKTFKVLEKRLGWHLLIIAAPIL